METKLKNIILGAGLTGLSAGYEAKDAVIYEKSDKIGGLARTEEFDGFRFDLGGHRFLTRKLHVEKFVKDLLKSDLLEVNRKSKIFSHHKLLDYPPSTSIFFHINPFELSIMLSAYLYRKTNPIQNMRSFKDKAINIFGDELYKYYFEKYTEKVWGIKCDEISKDWVEARLPQISLKRVIKHIIFKKQKSKSFSDAFLYPKYGIGMLCEKLSKDLNINLSSKVTSLKHTENKITSVIINDELEIPCEKIVSTIPINQLIHILKSPEKIINTANKLRYRNVICVFLAMNLPNLTNVHWIYFPDKEIFGRLHEPKNWSSHLSPSDKTGICLEIFCDETDKIWQMNDLEIATSCINDLYNFSKEKAVAHKVVKVGNAYPIYDLEYKKNLGIVKDYLSNFENLKLAGRTGNFNYLNMDDCIEEGFEAAGFLHPTKFI